MHRFIAPVLAALGLLLCTVGAIPASAAPAAQANNPVAIRAYAGVLRKINPQMPIWQSQDLARHVLLNARRWKIDANMLVALVTVESAWRTHAESWAGAIGLGQLMPGTAHTLHVNPRDPYQNLQGAARYLYGLLTRYRGKHNRYALTFAAYNAGPHAVAEYGGIPPYSETQNYVVKVMDTWQRINSAVRIPKIREALRGTAVAADASISPDLDYWTAASR
jgi:soluble lytic murein transglycosylase-like protein